MVKKVNITLDGERDDYLKDIVLRLSVFIWVGTLNAATRVL